MRLVELFDFPQRDDYRFPLAPLSENALTFIDRLQQWVDAHPSPDHLYRVQYKSSEQSIVKLDLMYPIQSLADLAKAFEDYDKDCRDLCQWQFPQSDDEPLIVKYCEMDSFVRDYVIEPLSPAEYLGHVIGEGLVYSVALHELRKLRDMSEMYFEQHERLVLSRQDIVLHKDVRDEYDIPWPFSLSLAVPQVQQSHLDDVLHISLYGKDCQSLFEQMEEILDILS